MITSSDLIGIVKSYSPNADEDLIRKAYIFAIEAHGMQKRASGAPYFYHPAEVARILAELKLDAATVITGLLHDVLEDTNTSFEELEEIFGSEIAFLVSGVTKLSKINYASLKIHQSENFRKFLLAISKDIRVLVVKLVDRLHNMRTLNYIVSLEKRKRISLETLEIYAPLAERIGMNAIKDEMENIAFYNIHPNEYSAISMRLEQIRNKDNNFVQNTILELQKILQENGINASVQGREKKIYSIWKKMQRRNVNLEQINDIIAFRVIVQTIPQCYLALGVVHTRFQIMPGRFKDYISIPKLNSYRSLHTTVIGPLKQPIEIQIRTEEMHHIADEGIAAHWAYKKGSVLPDEDPKSYSWIKSLLAVMQNSSSSDDIMANSRLEMFDDEVFCFTPNGDLITLPRGSTPVDFAYNIHTAVGNTCIGVRINGKMVPLKTVLKNGDQVEIITSPYQHPEAIWERFVVTGRAKACIKRFIKSQEKSEFIALGLQLIKYVFSNANKNYDESLIDLSKFSCKTTTNFYHKIGKSLINLNAIQSLVSTNNEIFFGRNTSLCLMDFTPGIAVHFSECCHPILGDKIIAQLVPQKGLVVHMSSCEKINDYKCHFIKVRWNQDDEIDPTFISRLRIVITNQSDSFANITNIISSSGASIANIKVEHRSIDFFDLIVDIKVTSQTHLGEILAALRVCSNARSVKKV